MLLINHAEDPSQPQQTAINTTEAKETEETEAVAKIETSDWIQNQ